MCHSVPKKYHAPSVFVYRSAEPSVSLPVSFFVYPEDSFPLPEVLLSAFLLPASVCHPA